MSTITGFFVILMSTIAEIYSILFSKKGPSIPFNVFVSQGSYTISMRTNCQDTSQALMVISCCFSPEAVLEWEIGQAVTTHTTAELSIPSSGWCFKRVLLLQYCYYLSYDNSGCRILRLFLFSINLVHKFSIFSSKNYGRFWHA